MTRIATLMHALAEMTDAETVAPFTGAAHYVVDASVLEMIQRTDCQDSIRAMIEAGVARLPYERVLLEFEAEPGCRRFVHLAEQGSAIRAETAALYRRRMATVSEHSATVAVTKNELRLETATAGNDGSAITLAVAMALLLLNTRGIERDVISPERLNKARRATGKPPIPSHTVLRIGTVYDRDGREVGDGHRRAMRVHMRAGHARNQACGPNRVDRHVVYIPPVLVNYRPGDEVPVPQRVVKR